jgi:capsular polysaccharide transport system permease protein
MNEQRIRNWQERRKSAPVDLDADSPAVDDQQILGRGAMPMADSRLEEARRAILERRNQRWRATVRRAMLLLVAPLAAILLYVSLFATPLYEGEAVFTVQTSASSAASPSAGIFAMTGGGSTIADAFKARAFILSRPMMEHMQKRYGFLDHFTSSNMDPLSRFDGPFGLNQDPFRYYLKRVAVSVDVQEGILRLHVQARTREDAIRFGNGILAAAERHVNASSDRMGADQIAALARDVQQAEQQVATSRRSLAAVQARRGDLNPEQTAAAVYQLISNLELQLAEAERQRDSLRGEGLVDSPLLPGLDQRVRELRSQINEQRSRLANPGGSSLSSSLGEYENASSRKEIAQARWQSTLNTLQQAYLEVIQQRRYFVLIVGMSAGTFAKVRDLPSIIVPILLFLAFASMLTLAARRWLSRNPHIRTARLWRSTE